MRDTKTSTKRMQQRQKVTRDFTKQSIISGGSQLLRDVSPGHTEIWFFGWAPQHYREHFPLHPMPAIAFTPLIINEIKKVEDKLPVPHPFIVDIRPGQETLLIKRRNNKLISKAPFVSVSKLKELKQQTMRFKPDNYTAQLYNDHMYAAYEHALVERTEQNIKKNPRAHRNAIRKQHQRAAKRAKRKHEQLSIKKEALLKEQPAKHIHKQRRGRKKAVITASLHKEINCPFCYNPDIKKHLIV